MNHKGNSILGDKKYKKKFKKFKNIDLELEKLILNLERQFLHAKTLGFIHPVNGKKIEFSSFLPQELENILKMLRKLNK
jgi:23S rRNA pseudouridine1911/1915/1917 synthase